MRYSCALMAHVYADPLSETTDPNCGFAITFTHGNGDVSFSSTMIVYSFPSFVKPPVPLKNIRSLGNVIAVCCIGEEMVFVSNKAANGLSGICVVTCSS